MSGEQVFRSVACLGCGCGCDDLEVRVRDGRIVALAPPCPVATGWFGDGSLPAAMVLPDVWAEVSGRLDTAAIRSALDGIPAGLDQGMQPCVARGRICAAVNGGSPAVGLRTSSNICVSRFGPTLKRASMEIENGANMPARVAALEPKRGLTA